MTLSPFATLPPSHYINGNWIVGTGTTVFTSINPANPVQVIGTFTQATPADVDFAVCSAKQALPAWQATPAPKRGALLFKLADYIQQHKEQWAAEMALEMGKPLSEARGDVQEAIEMATFMGGEGRRLNGFHTPSEFPNKWLLAVRQPVGVCGLITPWNFPIAVPSWKLFPALVAGNTVVFKPAEQAPLMGQRLVEACASVGFPAGVVNLVQGSGEITGNALVQHPDINLISFTGSTQTGKQIASICAEQHKLCAMELGGKNACIVWHDANIPLAVEGLLWGAFGTAGQRCTATSRLIIHPDIKKEVLTALLARIQMLTIGDPTQETTQLGPLIEQTAIERTERMVTEAQQQGATVLAGGHRLCEAGYNNGYFYAPTILDNVKPDMNIAQEEVFAPVLSVLTAETLEEAITIANGVRYGLSGAIYTQNMGLAMQVVEQLSVGLAYINAPTIGAETHVPFGGVKQSGNGHREASAAVLDTYTQWKTITIEGTTTLRKAQMDEVSS
jgi:acyl-CoA reductase-like NAD-dependent aldehyde dehydrogenase